MPDLVRQVAATIRRHGLLAAGQRVVLAVSGGADSAAMLAAFVELAGRRANRWALHVAHLDHGIRGAEARADARFVADLASQTGLPATIEAADVPALAAREGGGIEEVGRRARYDFLARVAAATAADAVATAHTADDNAETVLHRIFRGTGLKGLGGIPIRRPLAGAAEEKASEPEKVSDTFSPKREKVSDTGVRLIRPLPEGEKVSDTFSPKREKVSDTGVRLIRPLLEVRRGDVLAYLRGRGLAFREDATNADAAAMRNRIRREVLPLLAERVNPRIVEALNRLAASAADAWCEAESASSLLRTALTCGHEGDAVQLDAAGLRRLPPPVAIEVLRRALESLGAPLGGIGQGHLASILALAAAGRGGARLDLPDGLSASLARGRLALRTARGQVR